MVQKKHQRKIPFRIGGSRWYNLPSVYQHPPRAKNLMNIILVDDTPDHLELLSEFVRDLRPNANIYCLRNGLELTRWLEEKSIDLVMVDLMMPGISGFELIRQVRQNRRWDMLPIIAVSGLRQPNYQTELRKAGFSGYIVKPYEISDLIRVLDQHLPL
jgi:DNA-binding response OmpR family regulator